MQRVRDATVAVKRLASKDIVKGGYRLDLLLLPLGQQSNVNPGKFYLDTIFLSSLNLQETYILDTTVGLQEKPYFPK